MLWGRRIAEDGLPEPLMAPEAGQGAHFYRLPCCDIHLAPAPAILDEEVRRRLHVERCHVVVVVPAKRYLDPVGLRPRDVIALTDIVQRVEFDQEMMYALPRVLKQSKAVVACIHMQETDFGRAHIIADLKAQQILVEGQCGLKICDHKHNMSHALRAGSKAGDAAARRKRLGSQRWPVKCLEPVSGGIAK